MAHMSEKEWQGFAASKNLDPATGGVKPEPTELAGMDDRDFRQIMAALSRIRAQSERTQIFVAVGIAILILLHFV
jgi:hypothetical protein